MRDKLLPEAELGLLHNRLQALESDIRNVSSSLERRERDCAALQYQLEDIKNSHSWKITAPLRVLSGFLRSSHG